MPVDPNQAIASALAALKAKGVPQKSIDQQRAEMLAQVRKTGAALANPIKASTSLGDTLKPGKAILPGQRLTSLNGRFSAVLQADGNFVVYDGGKSLWASDTANPDHAVGTVLLQEDGDLVGLPQVHSTGMATAQSIQQMGMLAKLVVGQTTHWASDTQGNPGATLVLQNDGNLVLYSVHHDTLWSSAADNERKASEHDFFHWLSNVVQACGRAIGDAAKWIATGLRDIGKELSKIPIIGGVLHGIWAGLTGPITLTADIVSGKPIGKAFEDFANEQIKGIKEVAQFAKMIVGFIPGIGTLAGFVIGTGLALASGQNIGEALLDGVAAAIPGGAIAKAAFDVGRAALSGKSLAQVGMAAVEGIGEALGVTLPDAAKEVLSTGVDMTEQLAKGKSLDQALLAVAANHLPALIGPVAGPLLKTAGDAAAPFADRIKAQTDLANHLLEQGQKLIPNLPQDTRDAIHKGLGSGMVMGHASDLQAMAAPALHSPAVMQQIQDKARAAMEDSVVAAARRLVPPSAWIGFDTALGLAQHNVDAFTVTTMRNALDDANKQAFDMAMSMHVGRVIVRPQPSIAAPMKVAGFFMTQGMVGSLPSHKQAMMTAIASNPQAQVGAAVAVKAIVAARTYTWWQRLLGIIGIGPAADHKTAHVDSPHLQPKES